MSLAENNAAAAAAPKLLQSCLTLCDPMDYSLPGSSVHGIFQARVLSVKKQRHYFDNKGLFSQNYGFSSSHV